MNHKRRLKAKTPRVRFRQICRYALYLKSLCKIQTEIESHGTSWVVSECGGESWVHTVGGSIGEGKTRKEDCFDLVVVSDILPVDIPNFVRIGDWARGDLNQAERALLYLGEPVAFSIPFVTFRNNETGQEVRAVARLRPVMPTEPRYVSLFTEGLNETAFNTLLFSKYHVSYLTSHFRLIEVNVDIAEPNS
jgi:hypothetical protein